MHYRGLSKNESVIGLVIRSRAFGTRSYHSVNKTCYFTNHTYSLCNQILHRPQRDLRNLEFHVAIFSRLLTSSSPICMSDIFISFFILVPHRYQFSLAVPKVSIGRLINWNFGSVLGMFDWPPGTISQFSHISSNFVKNTANFVSYENHNLN